MKHEVDCDECRVCNTRLASSAFCLLHLFCCIHTSNCVTSGIPFAGRGVEQRSSALNTAAQLSGQNLTIFAPLKDHANAAQRIFRTDCCSRKRGQGRRNEIPSLSLISVIRTRIHITPTRTLRCDDSARWSIVC